MGKTWKRQADILAFSVVVVTGDLGLNTYGLLSHSLLLKTNKTNYRTNNTPHPTPPFPKEVGGGGAQVEKKSHTLEAAEGSLYFIWGRMPAPCIADRGCRWSGAQLCPV